MIDLSILIVNWNVKNLLKNCLQSIHDNKNGLDIEIVVVDNNSSDGSNEMVEAYFPQVKLIKNSKNLGFSGGNNQAIKASRGEYLLLLNPDTVVMPQALKIMIDFIKAHPKTGIIGPKILGGDGKIQLTCARNFPTLSRLFFDLTTLSKKFPKSKIFGSYSMGYWDHNDEREVDSISGACMLIRKAMLDEIGLLDENFFMYAEDTDLCYRTKKAKWKIWYLPKAQIIHYGSQSSQIDIGKMTIVSQESMYKFFRKHYGAIRAAIFRIIVILSMLFWNFLWLFCYIFGIEKDKSKIEQIVRRNNEILQWAMGMNR